MAAAFVELESQSSTAEFILDVVIRVSNTRFVCSAYAGLKTDNAAQMIQHLHLALLQEVNYERTRLKDMSVW